MDMNMTSHLLGVFANIYGSDDAMTFSRAVLVAIVGFCTVMVVLAVIALFIKGIAAIFDSMTKSKKPKADTPIEAVASAAPTPSASGVELVNVDEPTAAVIMAIVSRQSGISLDRLAFKSIKLTEDK